MTKYHINKKGVPAVCKAKTKPCPLGGEHFDSLEAAEISIQKELREEHGIVQLKPEYAKQRKLGVMYNYGEEEDKIKAIEEGYEDEMIAYSLNPNVKLAAVNKGLYLEVLRFDSDKEVSSAAQIAYENSPIGKLESLHNELITEKGKAKSVAGELVRASNSIIHSYLEYGDRIGVGYGKENCNGPFRYLHKTLTSLPDSEELTESMDKWVFDDEETYEKGLRKYAKGLVEYLEKNPELKSAPNTKDSLVDYYDYGDGVHNDDYLGNSDYDDSYPDD